MSYDGDGYPKTCKPSIVYAHFYPLIIPGVPTFVQASLLEINFETAGFSVNINSDISFVDQMPTDTKASQIYFKYDSKDLITVSDESYSFCSIDFTKKIFKPKNTKKSFKFYINGINCLYEKGKITFKNVKKGKLDGLCHINKKDKKKTYKRKNK